jgi:mannose-6-phosphate isomerase-like protein (cupin superfamily)
MDHFLELLPGRGTKLYHNGASPQKIKMKPLKMETIISLKNIIIINGERIAPANEHIINPKALFKVEIPPKREYMVINIGSDPIQVNFSEDPLDHEIIYDPYMYENERQDSIDPNTFKIEHPVPEGYIDTLAKWYSVKYTYADVNYIFIRPKLGISIQSHNKRQEHWEIVEGNPIIISGNNVYYHTKKADTFDHPFHGMHTIINPTNDWVLIKERYTGTFDEKDIVRIFNPNNYRD